MVKSKSQELPEQRSSIQKMSSKCGYHIQLNDLSMKTFLFAISACLVLLSCAKESQGVSAYSGQTRWLDCFSRVGIQTIKDGNQDSLIIIIPDNMPSQYNVAGKELEFDAEIRANTLAPDFPDPSIDASTLYQGRVSNVREKGQ